MNGAEPSSVSESAPGPTSADDDRRLAAGLRVEFDEVEQALERLDAGAYGQCESCGREIDDEVLAARPLARACADHLPT